MKKSVLAILAVVAIVLVTVLAIWPRSKPSRPFSIGPALPAGKVQPQLVSTWDCAVLLTPDGSLWGWGGRQFGLAHLFSRQGAKTRPELIGVENDFTNIAAGYMHLLALKSDGSLWGLGWNGSGQLAQSNSTNRYNTPVRIGKDKWAQIRVGAGHSLGLKPDGTLWAWGQNDRGQLGDGTKSNKFSPTLITSEKDWKSIEAGAFNSFALKQDGTIWSWGLDMVTGASADTLTPELADSSTNWVAMSAGDYCLMALKSDGTLWLRGQNASITAPKYAQRSTATFIQIGTDTDWAEVYAGQSYFLARKRDGSWWGCGNNGTGQLGTGKSSISVDAPRKLPLQFEPWALACGYGNTVLLTRDGNLWSWGERLGSGVRTRPFFWTILNRLLHRSAFVLPDPTIDWEPHCVWQLPPEIKSILGAGGVESTNNTARVK
jgi:alpha-tubulin suppressor-like RCC1 family protein